MARTLVQGMEAQFERDHPQAREVLAAEGQDEREHGEDDEAPALLPLGSESEEEEMQVPDLQVPAAVKEAARKLHENTGHRSNRRLARAPAQAIVAAKRLKCAICDEKRQRKTRRPATLPVPKNVSDQVHVDIFEEVDALGRNFYVIHAVDFTSRFQMAEVVRQKSSDEIVTWFTTRWLPVFGPPRVLVADQRREFISCAFEEMCARHSILLWHTAVQAPWQNGVCERAGGILKGLVHTLVKAHSVTGQQDLNVALQEAVTAYNGDINEMGVTPAQAALGRQPRMVGDVLGDVGQRLAEHGLIDDGHRPNLMRQMALRETAEVAMTRLHFSRSLSRAEVARSRSTTTTHQQQLEPGMIVYFFRNSKYNNKTSPSKKRLSLRRWHGPALLIAKEGHANVFVSFKGQLTKCAVEHVRPIEQVSADTWRNAIEDVVEAAIRDMTARGTPQGDQAQPHGAQPHELPAPSGEATGEATPSTLPLNEPGQASRPSDLPPVQPREFASAVFRGSSTFSTPRTSRLSTPMVSSRRTSTVAPPHGESTAAPGTPVPDVIRTASQIGGGLLESAHRGPSS